MPTLSTTLPLLTSVAAAAGVFVLVIPLWCSRRTGFRLGRGRGSTVAASDTGTAPAVLVRDPVIGLRGRPDYLLTEEADRAGEVRRTFPLELKPRRRSRRLYESDALQLGVYLLALRATYGSHAAPYGYVRYADETFRVALTPALETRIRRIVLAIRSGRVADALHRSHNVPDRCAGCAVRHTCDERLA
jgi:CRISPR-associated exonuclease Cas4